MGPEGDYTNETGRVFSPMYTQSAAECTLDLFYYINGDTGEWTDQDGVHQSSLGKKCLFEWIHSRGGRKEGIPLLGIWPVRHLIILLILNREDIYCLVIF